MKKYSVFVTIIALAELIYILAGGIGASPEKLSSSVRASAVYSATSAPRATATPKPRSSAVRPTATPEPSYSDFSSFFKSLRSQSSVTTAPKKRATPAPTAAVNTYILNTSTKKFHRPSCASVKQMAEKNMRTFTGPRSSVIDMGYKPCGRCSP